MYHLVDPKREEEFDATGVTITLCGKHVSEKAPMFAYLLWDKARGRLTRDYDICEECLNA